MVNENLSQRDRKSETKTCPDCGKEIGERNVCPYCGTDVRKRTSHKVLVILSVIILALGTFYLFTRAKGKPKHFVNIKSIDTSLNYGNVWIEGTVSSGPRYQGYPNKSLEFSIYDGTGEIPVSFYGEAADKIVESGRVPTVGDKVVVFGQVRVEEDEKQIRYPTLDKFKLTRTEPKESTVSEVRSEFFAGNKYQKVTTIGILTDLRAYGWMNTYKIEDPETGEPLEVFASGGLEELGPAPPENLKLYSKLKITGGVSEYQNSPQLSIRSYENIKVIGRAELPEVIPLSAVGENIGDLIGARGKIVFSRDEKDGHRFWLDNQKDDYSPTPLWIWDSTYELISDRIKSQLKRGARVKVYGEAQRYGGENQVELASPPEISILDNSGISTYTIETVDIQNIDNQDVGSFVTVKGTAEQLEKQGKQFTISGDTGEIDVSIPSKVWKIMTERPSEGDTVSVTGMVERSKADELVIKPGLPKDIEVIS